MFKLILIGFGPHARKNYYQFLEQELDIGEIEITALVELEDQKENINSYIDGKKLQPKQIILLDSSHRIPTTLDEKLESSLNEIIENNEINGIIIATEPKAHKLYIEWALKNNIPILLDKPITSPVGLTYKYSSASQIYQDYLDIKHDIEKFNGKITVLAQRRYHNAFCFVYDYLKDFISEFKVPISYIDIFHSDGKWNMPNEYDKMENHPYKYGYGKLMHSGYHMVDLYAWFLKLNEHSNKAQFDKIDIFSKIFSPNDFLSQVDFDDYKRFFKDAEEFKDYFSEDYKRNISHYGELDSYNLIQSYSGNRVQTTASLNFLQNSFSRRAWKDIASDVYKGNGRLRHERINIEVGPLLNIQVHCYECYESHKEKWPESERWKVGGDKHFDVYIFRNSELVGGKPLEMVNFGDLTSDLNNDSADLMKQARNNCILEFLSGENKSKSDYLDHELTNQILSYIYTNITKQYYGHVPYSILHLNNRESI